MKTLAESVHAAPDTKRCTKCSEVKSSAAFGKDPLRSDGLAGWCKPCRNTANVDWRRRNPEKQREATKAWAAANPEKVAAKYRRWMERNPGRAAELAKRFRSANPERALSIRQRMRRKQYSDVHHRIKKRISEKLRISLKRGKENRRTYEILGYSADELKVHLERQFTNGMTWDAFMLGEIHIDHIVPQAALRYETVDCPEFKAAWNLANLRPLWARENCQKKDKALFLL